MFNTMLTMLSPALRLDSSLPMRLLRHSLPAAKLSTTNNDVAPIMTNRNPRNLERLRIAKKPVGYYYDKKNVEYWHKLTLDQTGRYVTASLVHNTNKVVVIASTKEWAISKYLYSPRDSSAYYNLARVFAERCLETGITHCFSEIDVVESSKVELFLKTLEKEGLALTEPTVYNPNHIWHKVPEPKPWLVGDD